MVPLCYVTCMLFESLVFHALKQEKIVRENRFGQGTVGVQCINETVATLQGDLAPLCYELYLNTKLC